MDALMASSSRIADWRRRQPLVNAGIVRIAVIVQLVIGKPARGNA